MKKIFSLLACAVICFPVLMFSAETAALSGLFSIVQNGRVFPLKDRLTTLTLKRAAFQIRFNLQDSDLVNYTVLHPVQIAVWTNASLFESIADEVSNSEIPYFSPGTGMATAGIYDSIYLRDRAHHYIVSDPRVPADSRAVCLKDLGNGWRESEWPITAVFFYGGPTLPLEKSGLAELDLVILQDARDAEMVNAGEYRLLRIVFGN